jgi:biotin-(acetyl-CoA carboxylase) ligase
MRKNNQRKITYLNVGIGLKNLNPTVENVDKKILDKSYKKRKSAIELEQLKISLMKDFNLSWRIFRKRRFILSYSN